MSGAAGASGRPQDPSESDQPQGVSPPPAEIDDPGYTYIKWMPSPDWPGVVEIVLNRPRIHNALNRSTYAELDDAFERAGSSDAVRAVLLRGEGKSFCAGFDLNEHSELGEMTVIERWNRVQHTRGILKRIWECPVPVVGAVHGYCLGGGFALSMQADLVIAAEDAVFGEPEIKISAVPQPGLLWFTALRHAKEILMLGERFDAATAERYGIVNRVVARDGMLSLARSWAGALAGYAPEIMSLAKRTINKSTQMSGYDLALDWGRDLLLVSDLMETETRQQYEERRDRDGLSASLKWVEEQGRA